MRATVVFENKGELDVRAIRTFGVSAKEGDNPIGFFGTGLKYAISILLRNGHTIRILSGETVYEFSTKRDSMRGKEFEFVLMNNEELPFTTELGKTWNITQAFREIYCNCLDENGKVTLESGKTKPAKGITRVEVVGEEFENAYYGRDRIVLNLPEHLLVNKGDVNIYDTSASHVYYRGIAAGQTQMATGYTYNIIAKMELTEDRTLKHSWAVDRELVRAVVKMTNKAALRRILCAPKGTLENEFNYLHCTMDPKDFSEEFFEVMRKEYETNNMKINATAKKIFQSIKAKELPKEYKPIELTENENKSIARATSVVKKLYPDFDTFPVIVVATLGESIHGLAEMEDKTIILSKFCFTMGTKYIVSTMIEEYIHLTTRHRDCTRELQTYLFDLVTTMLEDHVLGEPI